MPLLGTHRAGLLPVGERGLPLHRSREDRRRLAWPPAIGMEFAVYFDCYATIACAEAAAEPLLDALTRGTCVPG